MLKLVQGKMWETDFFIRSRTDGSAVLVYDFVLRDGVQDECHYIAS
jgi:hypothetical protein